MCEPIKASRWILAGQVDSETDVWRAKHLKTMLDFNQTISLMNILFLVLVLTITTLLLIILNIKREILP